MDEFLWENGKEVKHILEPQEVCCRYCCWAVYFQVSVVTHSEYTAVTTTVNHSNVLGQQVCRVR